MGLYDWVHVKYKCPNCNKMEFRQFQTKDLGSNFREYNFGDHVSNDWINFLEVCGNCRCFIRAWGIVENNILKGIEIYRYSIDLENNKKIEKSYHWNGKVLKPSERSNGE